MAVPTTALERQRRAYGRTMATLAGDPPNATFTSAVAAPVEVPQDARPSQEVPVRRPTYGIFPDKDSWATLEVVSQVNGKAQDLYNSCYPGGRGPGTSNFLVQSMRWAPAEATQVVRTYGDWYLADTGIEPGVLLVSGVMLESPAYPWFQEWTHNWNQYLRARRVILNRTQVHLSIDNQVWRGYPLASDLTRAQTFQGTWMLMQFSFQMVIRSVEFLPGQRVFVGPDANTGPDENAILTFYASNFVEQNNPNPTAAASAVYGTEILRGPGVPLSGQIPALEAPDAGFGQEAAYEMNISRLTAIAKEANARAGRELFDVAQVRRDATARQNRLLANRGDSDPWNGDVDANAQRRASANAVAGGFDRMIDRIASGAVDKVRDLLW